MNITKCDICKKDTKGKWVAAGTGFFHHSIEVCYDCGSPIVQFLKKHKIIEEKNEKRKK
jgi:hypothetical protein